MVSDNDYFERLFTEHHKEHVFQQRALDLQAKEYERRLEDLNHAHQKSIEDRADFVTKIEGKGRDQRVDRIEQAVKELELNLIGKEHYESDRKGDTLKAENTATSLEDATAALAERLAEALDTAAKDVTTKFQTESDKVNARLVPLEKLAGRASLLFAGSAFVGGMVGYLVERLFG